MRFEAVWFRYARRADWTLREVEAAVEPGSTVVVLGRNGAGKSTLLQLAAGVLRPVRGAVRGVPATVGWVPERFPADQPFTAGDYLRRMADIRGVTDPHAVDRWIERLLLTEHTGTRLSALSKGTAQKVGLAQALLRPPGLLVLDEPWEGLDAVARTLVPEIVGEVTAAGGMVLVSDHRGEITALPGAIHWTVSEHGVHAGSPPAAPIDMHGVHAGSPPAAPIDDDVIVEVAIPRSEAAQAVAQLRAAGHRVLRIQDPDVRGRSFPPPTGRDQEARADREPR